MRVSRALCAISLIFAPWQAFGEYQTICYDSDEFSVEGQEICVTQDPGDASDYVIYFFHGLNGSPSEMGRGDMLNYINQIWEKELPGKKPSIIGYSLGRRSNLAKPGLIQLAMEEIFPKIEADYLKVQPKFRAALAISLGGWNLFHLTQHNASFFTKAAFLCPALAPITPWSSSAEIAAYRKRTGASWLYVKFMLQGVSEAYDNNEALFRPFSPYPLMESHQGSFGDLYIAVETKDEFGFQEGATHFAEKSAAKGSKVEFHLRPGGHCKSQKMDEVAKFLTIHSPAQS